MPEATHQRVEQFLKIIIAIAAVILVVLCVLLVREYAHIRRIESVAAHGSLFAAIRARGPVGASDARFIETWMTFDYLNHLFSLPPSYLQTSLAIADSRYPRITLAEYAADQRLDAPTFLSQVQNAVGAYFANQP
jgi:hypothetical protein